MMIRGIDVSSHNGQPFNAKTEAAFAESNFCIFKTTQALSYVNPCANYAAERTDRDGKLMGFYHYAGGLDPVAEADYFIKHSGAYFGKGIPVLDWESYQNDAWGDRNWCKMFCNRVHDVKGVWPMIYVQASALDQVANCAETCALWIAGYPADNDTWDVPVFPYSTEPWEAFTVWQYSSSHGTLDRNIANIDGRQWQAIAEGEDSMQRLSDEDVQRIAAACASYVWDGSKEDKENNLNMYNTLHWAYKLLQGLARDVAKILAIVSK